MIDNLVYDYENKSNKLQKVTDSSLTLGFNDGNKTGNDYTYDVNGNLTKDLNKGIAGITYNFLNLPTEVLWNTTKKINYTYNGAGVKLNKIVTDGTTVSTTEYLDGFQYKDGVLQFFPTAEGYVNAITAGAVGYNYVYNMTDHLGNVRVSYAWDNVNSKLKTVNEDHYYPFGLQHQGYNKPPKDITGGIGSVEIGIGLGTSSGSANYKYKYNGKELQDELSLNLYDYGARNYDPAIGRWMNVDPLAEQFAGWTPYHYVHNNPINLIDPTGMSAEWHEDGKGNLVKDEGDNAKTLKEHINKNYENADVSQSAANTLYASMKDGKVNINQLNPETLNQNLFGTNYPGPNNPKKYNGESDYSVAPTEFEKPAFVHDKDYDKLGAVGAGGLFLDNKTAAADKKFVKSMDELVTKYKNSGETKMMIKAIIVRDGLNAASQPKQMIQNLKNTLIQAVTPPASLTRPSF